MGWFSVWILVSRDHYSVCEPDLFYMSEYRTSPDFGQSLYQAVCEIMISWQLCNDLSFGSFEEENSNVCRLFSAGKESDVHILPVGSILR